MNRVCLTKEGKLIEMQGGGDDNPDLMEMRLDTLKQNALNNGYTLDQIDVKWVTNEEWAAIQAAQPKPDLPPDPLSDLITALINNGTLDSAALPTSISAMPAIKTMMVAKAQLKL
jgi:hypothetical protein